MKGWLGAGPGCLRLFASWFITAGMLERLSHQDRKDLFPSIHERVTLDEKETVNSLLETKF